MRTNARLSALALAASLALPACGTIFPRYHTATRPPPQGLGESGSLEAPPGDVRRLRFVSVDLPPSRSDDRQWDDDGRPDVYVVVYREGEELYRTPVARDTLRPEWGEDASFNLRVIPHARMRIEVRDDDGALSELIAETTFEGAPEGASEGGNVLLHLPRGVVVRASASAPVPVLGMGVEYEIHETWVRVLAIEAVAPARTAGLRVGDRITAIDGRPVADLGELGVRQAMDRASLRDVRLAVEREGAAPMVVDVRLGAVYPAR